MEKSSRIIRKLGKSRYLSLTTFKVGDVLEIRKVKENKEEVN